MAGQNVIDGDLIVRGNFYSTGSTTLGANSVGDTQVNASSPISATKLQHQHTKVLAQQIGVDCASEARVVHVVYGATATVVDFRAGAVTPAGAATTVTVDLKMADGVVTDFGHDVKACALGQASSSIMAQHVVGASAAELRAVRETMLKMLKENGAPPAGRFEDLKYLEPVRDYKARHASTMLTFDAVVDAIDQIEKKRAGKAA